MTHTQLVARNFAVDKSIAAARGSTAERQPSCRNKLWPNPHARSVTLECRRGSCIRDGQSLHAACATCASTLVLECVALPDANSRPGSMCAQRAHDLTRRGLSSPHGSQQCTNSWLNAHGSPHQHHGTLYTQRKGRREAQPGRPHRTLHHARGEGERLFAPRARGERLQQSDAGARAGVDDGVASERVAEHRHRMRGCSGGSGGKPFLWPFFRKCWPRLRQPAAV